MKVIRTPLARFVGDLVEFVGLITRQVEIGAYLGVQKLDMEFILVRICCAHNVTLGRTGLEDLEVLASI